jgi:hypothetical protein
MRRILRTNKAEGGQMRWIMGIQKLNVLKVLAEPESFGTVKSRKISTRQRGDWAIHRCTVL